LYENLASSFRQDYPKFEIIFSVADENDPAIKIVKDLIKKYPKVDARLTIGLYLRVTNIAFDSIIYHRLSTNACTHNPLI